MVSFGALYLYFYFINLPSIAAEKSLKVVVKNAAQLVRHNRVKYVTFKKRLSHSANVAM
jgi:hypothetical protein